VQTSTQQKDIDALKAAAAQTDESLKAQLASLAQQAKQPATPQQIVIDASKMIPNLPTPLQVQQIPVNASIPDGPKVQQVVIPDQDVTAVRDYGLACQAAADKLTACTSDQSNLQKQLSLTGAQRDEWQKAAKGGSFWHRALTAAKWIAIGGAAGYVAAKR
jgi:hypothetical protein